jgi:hypothetical protein
MPAARAMARFRLSAWVADTATNDPLDDLGCLPDRRIGRQALEVLNVRALRFFLLPDGRRWRGAPDEGLP